MAHRAIQQFSVSIRLACEVFSISQSSYYYQPKHQHENELIANGLIRLTTTQLNRAIRNKIRTTNGIIKPFITTGWRNICSEV